MHEYLKNHIIEELEGAEDYWSKAVEHKGTEAGCIFRRMAEMELEHANALLKMFNKLKDDNESEVSSTTTMKGVETKEHMYKEILEAYTEKMTKIEHMKKLYWKEE